MDHFLNIFMYQVINSHHTTNYRFQWTTQVSNFYAVSGETLNTIRAPPPKKKKFATFDVHFVSSMEIYITLCWMLLVALYILEHVYILQSFQLI